MVTFSTMMHYAPARASLTARMTIDSLSTMKQFDIPTFYRSPVVSKLKVLRSAQDPRKKDRAPSVLDLGVLQIFLARHFGFCYGVENAIEIAYRAIAENPGKRVFLLSEMIHNSKVNRDLQERGVRFLLSTAGEELIPFSELKSDDIVIVPAFGTTVALFERLASHGVNPYQYNATCPFVEKVWKRAAKLGEQGYAIIIHGKHYHEETKATFSHAEVTAPTLVIRDLEEAQILADYLRGKIEKESVLERFKGKFSTNFTLPDSLERIGVVNQTTMLAGETNQISQFLKEVYAEKYGSEQLSYHFADTRDTLCYATTENQESVLALLEQEADLALVIGGYNSSNTFHLAKLLAGKFPTYHIRDAEEIRSCDLIQHFDLERREESSSANWWPQRLDHPLRVVITAGASCPDALVDQVIARVAELAEVSAHLQQLKDTLEQEATVQG